MEELIVDTLSEVRRTAYYYDLPEGLFDELVNLKTLHLSYNAVGSIPEGIFDDLANLQTLDLRENSRLQLSFDLLEQLINLEAYNGGSVPWAVSPGVLHGRTRQIADAILNALGTGITQYN